MDNMFVWIKKHKLCVVLISLFLFIAPLSIVHFLFKQSSGPSWLVAEWSAGDVLGYIAGFETLAGTILLSTLALWQNQKIHNEHIESQKPILSMKLVSSSHGLYLIIENTGSTEAKNIHISILDIFNNGAENKPSSDDLFKTTFELYPNEFVQGCVAPSGANIATHIFPQIRIQVSYLRPDTGKIVEYDRTVTYNSGYDTRVSADIHYDNSQMESDVDKIARASVRMANYLDGCQVAKFDELNILAGKSLRNDLVEAIKTKENIPVLSRSETIDTTLSGRKSVVSHDSVP